MSADEVIKSGPAFQFYARDFELGTAEMSCKEVGIYIRLLCFEWDNYSLPDNLEKLAGIARCSLEEFKEGWSLLKSKFIKNIHGRLINAKMERVRSQQIQYRERQSEAGKRGAHKRWHDNPNGDPIGDPNGQRHGENIALQSSSSTPTPTSEKKEAKKPLSLKKILDEDPEINELVNTLRAGKFPQVGSCIGVCLKEIKGVQVEDIKEALQIISEKDEFKGDIWPFMLATVAGIVGDKLTGRVEAQARKDKENEAKGPEQVGEILKGLQKD